MRLVKYLTACTLLVLIGLITASTSSAQWPMYSGSFYDSTDFSSFRTPYGNYPLQTSSSGLWSRGWENYNNWSYNDIFSPYSNSFLTSGSFVSPALSLFNQPNGKFFLPPTFSSFPQSLYTGFTNYNTFLPNVSSSLMSDMFNPYIPSRNPAWYSPLSYLPSYLPSSIIPIPRAPDPEPASAPKKMTGEWKSQQLTDENGCKMEGNLEYDRDNNLLKITDSSLPLGEGVLSAFEYTPTSGDAPISFKGIFESGYTAYFSGIAYNSLCPKGVYCSSAGHFEIEGTYKIKNNEGQIVDKGTFDFFI